jgi:hypothetical protein
VRYVEDSIETALRQTPDFEAIRDNVVVSVTGEDLRMDLLETEHGMFFVFGDPTPTSVGVRLLKTLARSYPAGPVYGPTRWSKCVGSARMAFRRSIPSNRRGAPFPFSGRP